MGAWEIVQFGARTTIPSSRLLVRPQLASPEFQQRLKILPDMFVGGICRGRKPKPSKLECLLPIDVPVRLLLLVLMATHIQLHPLTVEHRLHDHACANQKLATRFVRDPVHAGWADASALGSR